MSITTYAELQTAIADFLNRDDLTAVVPDFITLAEARIQRDLEHWQMEKRATASVTTQYVALPTDFLHPKRLHIQGQHQPLDPMAWSQMQESRDSGGDSTGVPRYYALVGGELELWPTPGNTYTLEMYYTATLSALSVSNTSNWLLAQAPDIYLYGSLINSAPYLSQDERVVAWGALYQSGIDALQKSSERAKWGGGNLVIR